MSLQLTRYIAQVRHSALLSPATPFPILRDPSSNRRRISFELLVRDWMRLLFLRFKGAMFCRGGPSASAWAWCPEPQQSLRFAAWKARHRPCPWALPSPANLRQVAVWRLRGFT